VAEAEGSGRKARHGVVAVRDAVVVAAAGEVGCEFFGADFGGAEGVLFGC
jgi:hypothetical protein